MKKPLLFALLTVFACLALAHNATAKPRPPIIAPPAPPTNPPQPIQSSD